MDAEILRVAREALYLALLLSIPVLAASLVVGLVISLLQAVTQVQEQTLSFVPKLVAALLALAAAGPWIGSELARFTTRLWNTIPTLFP
ncbi:MAG: flagellar biosynthesis protein FliQ [Deltaproteobacteria bacterium]|nr:flagellar biosynthesis protein FliQ [Deltaproteobacteria bacterium]